MSEMEKLQSIGARYKKIKKGKWIPLRAGGFKGGSRPSSPIHPQFTNQFSYQEISKILHWRNLLKKCRTPSPISFCDRFFSYRAGDKVQRKTNSSTPLIPQILRGQNDWFLARCEAPDGEILSRNSIFETSNSKTRKNTVPENYDSFRQD